ncbi:hypothetical protein MIR68_010628 [Amoeboaphelidium protococcarum]|nr:hypothetical protein MIR68_010628 [Amoeboaphelidium protococcarum]KAI3642367.1 hypothetical protein MP228_011922 [Amoeboaphelidium protococcarum]
MDSQSQSPSQLRAYFEKLANPPTPSKSKWSPSKCSSPEGLYVKNPNHLQKGPPPKKTFAELP